MKREMKNRTKSTDGKEQQKGKHVHETTSENGTFALHMLYKMVQKMGTV